MQRCRGDPDLRVVPHPSLPWVSPSSTSMVLSRSCPSRSSFTKVESIPPSLASMLFTTLPLDSKLLVWLHLCVLREPVVLHFLRHLSQVKAFFTPDSKLLPHS